MITGRGRPLRFLVAVACGWIALRVFMLWPQLDSAADVWRAITPVAIAAAAPVALPPDRPVASTSGYRRPHATRSLVVAGEFLTAPVGIGDVAPYRVAPAQVDRMPLLPGLPQSFTLSPSTTSAPPFLASRWSGSAWFVARGGAGIAPGALGGQLGGSQAGLRLAYLLDRKHRLALIGRLTSPLGNGLREASFGAEWQPTKLPIRLVIERRFALSEGKGGPAVGAVGGFGPIGIPLGFRIEGYGQAGAIRRSATEAYADGAVRTAHSILAIGRVRLELGAGIWGAAQRGAARLDIGPSFGLIVPLGKQPVRLLLDWRQRVTGDAQPGSGPSLTLGTDF